MSISIKAPGFPISASTSSQRTQITVGQQCKFLRVVNGSTTAVAYVNAGGSTVAATSNNFALAPFESRNLERDPNTDSYVAVLLSGGTAIVSFMPCGEDNL